MLLQKFGGCTMINLLKSELENSRERYAKLLGTKRQDQTAKIVLNRIGKEINNLERIINHEEKPRKEVATRTSSSGIARCFMQTIYRLWDKRDGNNHAIP